MNKCIAVDDEFEASLRDLMFNLVKMLAKQLMGCPKTFTKSLSLCLHFCNQLYKELKPLLAFLQSTPQAAHILPRVEDLVAKEKELQERLILEHATVVDSYEKKTGGREIENQVASRQKKIIILK